VSTKIIYFRTIITAAILTLIYVCTFVFIPPSVSVGSGVSLKVITTIVGLLVIVFYHIFDRPSPQTTKLSLTVCLTVGWLGLILFFPFNPPPGVDPTSYPGGVIGFFALLGGLAICVLWVHFFADEIIQ
jgi:hypothetical protein